MPVEKRNSSVYSQAVFAFFLSLLLHQRGNEAHETSQLLSHPAVIFTVLHRDKTAFLKGLLKITLHVKDHRIAVNIGRAFKMQVKAAEIQVNGTHHSLFVVADKNLGVDKAGVYS